MRTSWIKFAGLASIVAFVAIIIRLLLSNSPDAWMCVNGSWVARGNPIDPKPPDSSCGWPSVELDK